jgi:hypothetical protein
LRTNCLLKQIIEGKIKGRIEVTGRRGRASKQLLDDLKEKRGYLKDEALDHTVWLTRFGRGCGSVAREITEWMNAYTRIYRLLSASGMLPVLTEVILNALSYFPHLACEISLNS